VRRSRKRVCVLVAPDAALRDIAGPWEVLRNANGILGRTRLRGRVVRSSRARTVDATRRSACDDTLGVSRSTASAMFGGPRSQMGASPCTRVTLDARGNHCGNRSHARACRSTAWTCGRHGSCEDGGPMSSTIRKSGAVRCHAPPPRTGSFQEPRHPLVRPGASRRAAAGGASRGRHWNESSDAPQPRVPLEATDLSIKDISARTGLGDVNTMWRLVAQHVGVTPTEYRGRFAVA
jgi:hypothetical protein